MKLQKVIIKGFIWAKLEKWNKEYDFTFFKNDGASEYLLGDGYIPIAPYEIDIEFPKGLDLYQATLTALQNKRKLVLAENEQRINTIDGQIQEFLAVEHKADDNG